MAWNTINYTCGHTVRIQLYGPHSERDRIIAAMEKRQCPECEMKAAQERAAATGLPELAGSPKQISWASDIRDKWLTCDWDNCNLTKDVKKLVDYLVEAITSKTNDPETAQSLMSAALVSLGADADWKTYDPTKAQAAFRTLACTRTAAKWWIDNRGMIGRILAKEIINDIQGEQDE